MSLYTVRYHAGTYTGIRYVNAESEEEALRVVRARIRREMSLPMYSDSYRIVNERAEES